MIDSLPPEVHDGDWVFAERCPLCEAPSSEHAPFETADSELGQLAYVICRACGFVFQSPRPTLTWLRSYYQGGYHLHMHGQEQPEKKTIWVETRRAECLLAFARPHLPCVKNHLDIGSSLGRLLSAFGEAFGCQSHGIEPSDVYRRSARRLGVDVVGSLSELDDDLACSFDFVSLSHVLEHMTDPLGTLRRIHNDWMQDESHLLVEVPNLFGHPALELAHLSAFTSETLVGMLKHTGFVPVAIQTHGQPFSKRLPFYIRALARRLPGWRYRPPARPNVTWIRWRRGLGMWRLKAAWAVSSRLLGRARLAPWAG